MFRKLTSQIVWLMALDVFAGATLIDGVSRSSGNVGWPDPHLASTTLQEGALTFCDRQYVYTQIPTFLLDAEYIVTENNDKYAFNVQYSVTIAPDAGEVYAFVWLDNRWTQPDPYGENPPYFPGWPAWLADGGWVDTGADIAIWERTVSGRVRYNSVFYKPVLSGTTGASFYTGPAQMDYSNFYGIAVLVPEPSALLLLGIGASVCIRRRG